ncbi:pectin lyase-like protein, partial [Lentithecium fluviatile CBS 122367]
GNDHHKGKTVKPGQSIQEALKSAKKGDTITVEAGTYAEQLTISTSDITLVGKPGAILTPPGTFYPNPCSGLTQTGDTKEEAGICIHGQDVILADYVSEHKRFVSVGSPIKNVEIRGFEVRGFKGVNIAVLGAKETHIHHNRLVDGGQYGFLTVGSTKTLAEHNTITASSLLFIAMCMDDQASAQFSDNELSGYFIALCTQTPKGLVKKNTVSNCCIGPFVDPGIVGARVLENTIRDRNPACPPGPNGAGAGIVLFGAQQTVVKGNKISNIKNEGNGVGIFVSDVTDANGVVTVAATGNVVKGNVLKNNDFDILSFAAGVNDITRNDCVTEAPGDYC